VKTVDTHVLKKCWIYIFIVKLKRLKLKDSLEVVRQQNECAIVLPIQGHEYIILGPIWLFAYTLLMYNIWVHEADVVDPLLPAFLHFHPAR